MLDDYPKPPTGNRYSKFIQDKQGKLKYKKAGNEIILKRLLTLREMMAYNIFTLIVFLRRLKIMRFSNKKVISMCGFYPEFCQAIHVANIFFYY